MEVVLPNGELMRTGGGGVPGRQGRIRRTNAGWGRLRDQLLSCSRTAGSSRRWASGCLPTPECFVPCWLKVWRESDLAAVVDSAARADARRDDTGWSTQILNALLLGPGLLEPRPSGTDGDEPLPDEVDRQRSPGRLDIGRWTMPASRAARRRGGRQPQAQEGEGGVRADRRAPRSPARSTAGTDSRRSSTGSRACRRACRSLDMNAQTAWYGGGNGGRVGFPPVRLRSRR